MIDPRLLIQDLYPLMQKYSAKDIIAAVNFLDQYNDLTPSMIHLTDGRETKVTLTRDQWRELRSVYNSGPDYNKIQAIKKLREFTYIGLKEAKDIVELFHENLKY